MNDGLSYAGCGVNINDADSAKQDIAQILDSNHAKCLNKTGAFAALYDADFREYKSPVLVLKAEEPGSKQLLSIRYGKTEWICRDLINHLTNDIAVMGAKPLAVLDTIICGRLEKDTIVEMVRYMSQACNELGCVLIGGETSEQPGTLQSGTYVLSACVVGIAEKEKIVDGSGITPGDCLLALPSNGPHTNGFSLIRKLIDEKPGLMHTTAGEGNFLDAILKPHTSYYLPLKNVLESSHASAVHGMAHITGGGMRDNLIRILPEGCRADIDLAKVRVPQIFKIIKHAGNVPDADMLRTFNNGVGMILAVDKDTVGRIKAPLFASGIDTYEIGRISSGERQVGFYNTLDYAL